MIGSDIAPRDTVLTWDLELWGPDDLKIQREEIPKESVAILGHRMDRHVFNVYKMFMQQYMEGKITYTALPGLPPFTTNPCIWRGLQSLLWSTKHVVVDDKPSPALTVICKRNFKSALFRELKAVSGAAHASLADVLVGNIRLPADLPCCPDVEVFRISDNDPRVGLRGQQGVRVKPGRRTPLPKGTFIGPYRGRLSFGQDYANYKLKAFGKLNGAQRERQLDSYSASIEFFSTRTIASDSGFEYDDMHATEARGALIVSAFGQGNLTCIVNDPILNPHDPKDMRRVAAPNCTLLDILIGPWPFLSMFTTCEVKPGEEMFYSYGHDYWDIANEHAMRWAELKKEFRKGSAPLHPPVTTSVIVIDPGIDGQENSRNVSTDGDDHEDDSEDSFPSTKHLEEGAADEVSEGPTPAGSISREEKAVESLAINLEEPLPSPPEIFPADGLVGKGKHTPLGNGKRLAFKTTPAISGAAAGPSRSARKRAPQGSRCAIELRIEFLKIMLDQCKLKHAETEAALPQGDDTWRWVEKRIWRCAEQHAVIGDQDTNNDGPHSLLDLQDMIENEILRGSGHVILDTDGGMIPETVSHLQGPHGWKIDDLLDLGGPFLDYSRACAELKLAEAEIQKAKRAWQLSQEEEQKQRCERLRGEESEEIEDCELRSPRRRKVLLLGMLGQEVDATCDGSERDKTPGVTSGDAPERRSSEHMHERSPPGTIERSRKVGSWAFASPSKLQAGYQRECLKIKQCVEKGEGHTHAKVTVKQENGPHDGPLPDEIPQQDAVGREKTYIDSTRNGNGVLFSTLAVQCSDIIDLTMSESE